MRKKVSIDIDGIFNDYPVCWLNYIKLTRGISYSSKEVARKELGEKVYSEIKDSYRTSEYKANLPVSEEARHFCRSLYERNYEIIIATSRPINNSKYPHLFELTRRWLEKNDIPFDDLRYKARSEEFIAPLKKDLFFHIEDELEYAEFFASHGVKTFLYLKDQELRTHSGDNIICFRSFQELESFI